MGPAEDIGQDPDDLPIDDYWEPSIGTPMSFVGSEVLLGPFSHGLPITLPGMAASGISVSNSITEPTRTDALQRLKQLNEYLDCEAGYCHIVSEMRTVALELWEARVLTGRHARSLSVEESMVVSLILSTRPLWIRSLADWQRPSGSGLQVLIHLAEFLLARYPAPEWLQLRKLLQPTIRRRHWYAPDPYRNDTPWDVAWPAYLASVQGLKLGPVLHFCASKCGIDLPASSARFAFEVPETNYPNQAFQWLLVRAHGGSPDLATRLAGILPTLPEELIRALIQVFVKAPTLIEHAQLIVESIVHQYTEFQRTHYRQPFRLTMRSPARILKEALEYRESQNHFSFGSPSGLHWNSRGWDVILDHEGQSWSIKELIDGLALYEESKNMRHCVASYAKACEGGRSAIFSVTVDGHRRVTVEVNPKTRRVVQVHGFANRMPTAQESRIVNRWCAQFDLVPDRG